MNRSQTSTVAFAALALALAACQGAETARVAGDTPAAQDVTVTVTPAGASLTPGQILSLRADVTGTADTAVTWSIEESSGSGSVTAAGVYTAPATPGTYHVDATSHADPTRSAAATITVTATPPPPQVVVTVAPANAALRTGQSLSFSASVTGSADTAVTWSVREGPAGGGVTAAGLYTAPTTPGTYHLDATSHADPTKSGAATIAVSERSPVTGGPMTTASRTSGVAPLAIFFDAVDTVPSGYASPFAWTSGVVQPADLEGALYSWDFGDPGSGAWTTTGNSRNTATGYTVAHVFETPGTYTVALSVTDVNGLVDTYVQAITVSAFSGTTYYVAANGSDANDGLSPATPFLTKGKGLSMAGTNRRILFRRGDTFAGSNPTITAPGPGIIGAYGSGARPILTSGVCTFKTTSDWRVMDIESPGGIFDTDYNVGPSRNLLMLRCYGRDTGVPIGWGDWNPTKPNPNSDMFVVDCESNNAGTNGAYVGGHQLAVMGSYIHDVVPSHCLRVWEAHKGYISNNKLWNPGPTRHALKLHGTGSTPGVPGDQYSEQRPETRWVTINDNLIRGKTWSVAIGPEDSGADERISHVVYERNRHFGEASVQVDLIIWARNIVVRNNIMDGTGASSYYTGIGVSYRGSEPLADQVRIYNNTVVRTDSSSEFYAVAVAGGVTNVTVRNNFASGGSAGVRSVLDTSGAALGGGGPGAGLVQDHNLLTTAPLFTNVAGGDFTLQASSPAVDAGVTLGEVRQDFLRATRPQGAACDLGAYESH